MACIHNANIQLNYEFMSMAICSLGKASTKHVMSMKV